ncbi:uncharacterized protein B0H64DRAFT_366146 [Chaetomium fimeti]|uniref:Protein kinase domain-containing protein n=1 Tax=Chaetomium fimeti TaxID=1854472 RepID=A0AAE0H8R7_9PEZI|nr:hypothetical protein B0H64DRAFT_366146 [Chaetomium fimeti]
MDILAFTMTCFELGDKVLEICETWKNTDGEVEQRVVIVNSTWDRTKRQAEFMSRIAPIIDDGMRRIMDDLLRQLSLCLTLAMNTLETVNRRASLARPSLWGFGSRAAKKASWVWKKETLDSVIIDLEAWKARFDPSWFLLMKIANPIIDSELAKARVAEAEARGRPTAARHPFAVAAGLRTVVATEPSKIKFDFHKESQMERHDIQFSTVKVGRLARDDPRWYILDTVEVGPAARVRDIGRDVRVLATKLAQTDAFAFGLLNCKGVIAVPRHKPVSSSAAPGHRQPPYLSPPAPSRRSRSPSPNQHDYTCFRFVFRIPDGVEVEMLRSLRQLLLNSDAHISLTRKLGMARELAKAVSYVHTFAFVHKNVRPESVLWVEGMRASKSPVFLVGFDAFRGGAADTIMAGDMRWDRNVYRHPLRQGNDPAEKYRMHHDIYSLGVCLLEIGLWESFVEYTTEAEVAGPPQAKLGRTYHHFQEWLRATEARTGQDGSAGFLDAVAFRLKDYLVERTKARLAPRMGEKYARVVLSCLTCLDDNNEDFDGAEAADASDDATALCFIEGIMKALDEISV